MDTPPHPSNVRAQFSENLLRELYLAERLTIARVSSRLGIAPTTVRRRLAALGLQVRRRGPIPRWDAGVTGEHRFQWTAELAWVIGIIATDGNLSSNGRSVAVTSKDVDLPEVDVRRP
jgi:hypothetical protein